MDTDIRETGPIGLRYDSNRGLGQSTTDSNPLMQFLHQSGKNINATVNQYAGPTREYVGEELAGLGFGNSQYDEGIVNISQADNLNEFRAQAQPWYDQITNGALKMVTTAATTFIDGTLGTLWGLGTGISNLLDDDPNTGFWRGMWDNAVSNAMADVNDKMEEVAHNYRSEWEQNASVFERMFSAAGAANFWGDDILKNAGFTIGAAGSIWATGAAGNVLKAIPGLSRVGKGLGLLTKGEQGLEATGAGKAASWLAKTFASTQGEAAIETLNSTRESLKALDAEELAMRNEGGQQALFEFQNNVSNGMDIESAKALYDERIENLNTDISSYRNHMQQELSDAGNMIYAANIAALSISNNLTLSSMIRGGYGNAKSLLNQAVKTANGKPIETAKEAGEALLKGELRFAAPEVKNKAAKAFGHWALTATQEGLEEGVQNLASNIGQIVASARTHQWAKDNTMLGSMINADAEEDLVSYSKALGKAYEDQFGHLNSPGWTEVVAGFITGAFGVASVHRNLEGNIRPTWQGGIKESWETITGNQKAVQAQADALNKALTDNKFQDRVRHAVQQIAIKKGQEDALERGDIQAYKNYEIQQLLSDAVFFRDMGMLDDYLAMYEAMANNVSDQDVSELKAMAKQEDGKASSLESMTDEDIKNLYKDKANSALEKIKESLNDYKAIEDQYGDKFSDETRREATMEMAFLNTLYWDSARRRAELDSEIDELVNKERTPLEDLELKQKQAADQSLTRQMNELRDTLNKYKNSPKILQETVKKRQLDRQKINLFKKAEAAIIKYKEAETLQDIVDVYTHSPEQDREKILNQAIEQSEGDVKDKLQQFKNYIGDVNTLEYVIEDKFPLTGENAQTNLRKLMAFKSILNEAVNEMLSDESPVLSRATLKDKFNEKLQEFVDDLENEKFKAGEVTIADDGNLDFNAAIDSGSVSMDDFDEILDNEETGESHLQIKEGSKADEMAEAAQNVKQYQELINDMSYLIDSLDKLDELREAAKKKEDKKKERKDSKKPRPRVDKEVIEGEDEDKDGDNDTFNFDDEDESGEDSEPPAKPKPRTGTRNFLTDEESSAYSVNYTKGESGITYNTVKRKKSPENKKAKESLQKKMKAANGKLRMLITAFDSYKSKPNKQKKVVDDILDTIANNIVSNSVVKEVEELFSKNSGLLKANKGEDDKLPPFDGKDENIANSDISLNGNQFPTYVGSVLSSDGKLVPITYQKSGEEPIQVWLEKNGFNIQEIVDNYLHKVVERDSEKATKDKTPIYYIHSNEQPNVVFLGIEYSQVEDLIPRDIAKKLVQGQDGKNYLLVGTLGWESARQGTKSMFENILNATQEGEHTSDGWHINTEHTNRIKDLKAGYTVKQTENDSNQEIRDLSELLQDPTRNPLGLGIEDLSWTVIEGTEEKPTRKVINGEASKVYNVRGGKPGQVYLNIPASNGNFIPVYIETMFLDELDQNTPLFGEILSQVKTLADPDTIMQDKKSAMVRLNDLLLFSEANQIHLNDSESKFDPDTIYITRDGQAIKVLDFENPISDDNTATLLDAILSINPRINHSITVLDRNPGLYLQSGTLKTDVAMLGTANGSFFLYPVNSEGEYVENKPFKGTGKSYDASVKNRIYVAGKYVYYDGSKFTDANGSEIEDEDGTLDAAIKIKNGKIKPIKVGRSRANYYVVDDIVYADNGHGGINVVGVELAAKVLEVANKKSSNNKKKDAAKKEASKVKKRKEEAPVDDKRLKAKTPDVDEGEEGESFFDESDDNVVTPETVQDFIQINNTNMGFSRIFPLNEWNKKDQDIRLEPDGWGTKNGLTYYKKSFNSGRKGDNVTVWFKDEPSSKVKSQIELFLERGTRLDDTETLAKILNGEMIFYPSSKESSSKSNFSNGTDIDNVKSQAELEAKAASSTFTTVLAKRENRAKTRELYGLIENKFGKKVKNNAEAVAELMKPEHKLDLSSNDLDTVIDQVKNCR